MQYQAVIVFCVIAVAAGNFEDRLKKLWIDKDSDSIIDVTSASIVIKPSSYKDAYTGRDTKLPYYSFKPRAIPIRRDPEQSQLERNIYYANDIKNKSDRLFPGNYVPIAKAKSVEDDSQMIGGFYSKAIPLVSNDEFQKRSLDDDEVPIIEKPEGFMETASRRSLSDIFGEGDDEDEEFDDDDGEYEVEDLGNGELERKKNKRKKLKPKKLKKYMLPLLMAYKLKYFALVPVMVAGLVLLVGATGLAGFFFALFAAVMGLQKGGY